MQTGTATIENSVEIALKTGNRTAISSVQLLSRVRLFETPWIAARQASLPITISQNYNEISPHTSQNGHHQKVYKQ